MVLYGLFMIYMKSWKRDLASMRLLMIAAALLATVGAFGPLAALHPASQHQRCSRPLLLAKKKGKGVKTGKGKGGQGSNTGTPLVLPDGDMPLMSIPPPSDVKPVTAGAILPTLQAGWEQYVDPATGDPYYVNPAGESTWDRPTAPLPAPPPPVAGDLPPPEASDFMPSFDGGLPFGNEPTEDGGPKLSLPSFEEYSRGPAKPVPKPGAQYESKLAPINPGNSNIELPTEETLFEKTIYRLTWGGIISLVLIEIFINTPAFQAVKPVILNFLGDGQN